MSTVTIRLIKAAFAYLGIGIALATMFAIDRRFGASLRPLHAELNLWGWATLLIYGMGYHMLPRFTGRPLASARLPTIQSALAIVGTGVAAIGWLALVATVPLARSILVAGGALEFGAALLFVWQIGKLLLPNRP